MTRLLGAALVLLLSDWFALLNRGERILAAGSSDREDSPKPGHAAAPP